MSEPLCSLCGEPLDVHRHGGKCVMFTCASSQDDTITALRTEVERLTVNGIHTCHDQCQRPACVLRREVEMVRAELAEARETIIAFAGPWATQYALDSGLPEGHLHPTHYDILAKAGARLDDFTRATPNEEVE